MSFKSNDSQQMTFNDAMFGLTPREKRMLEKSWAKHFSEKIFPLIDENKFACLYSDKASRPNTPVNVCVGALIIKEAFNMTDDEMVEALAFDIRYQYALHTTSFDEQPLSDKTLSRFRKRCYTYELTHGIDIIHDTITELSGEMAKFMKITGQVQRMDSLMVASNIKRLSRMELLYTCLSNFVAYLHNQKEDDKLDGFEHYYDPNDYNRVIYHQRNDDYDERLQTILADADLILKKCNDGYDEVSEYQLLARAFSEQVIKDGDTLRLKNKDDGSMNSSILQNPADPEATYREKAGKQYRGYVANVTESVGDDKSIITDYQFEQNTHSDSDFLKEHLETTNKRPERVTIVTDGAYSGEENHQLAESKNIELVTTDLLGRETKDIYADFIFSDDGQRIRLCPEGHEPKKSSFVKSNGQVRASFPKSQCENCPRREECKPKLYKKTSAVYVSKTSHERAKAQRLTKSRQFKFLARLRNGVETVPSTLRRKYDIDRMPVRGKIRMKHLFGFKIGALNFRKLLKYLSGLDECTQNPQFA
jgi:hypothetical protein